MAALTAVVTVVFYFLRRVPYGEFAPEHNIRYDQLSCRLFDLPAKRHFAIAYAANDIVLIFYGCWRH